MANGRCRLHGGKSPNGIAHPRYKHGLRSKYMPRTVAALFQEAAADPELLSVREDAATLVARVHDLLQRVPETPASQLWQQLRAAHAEQVAATNAGDTQKAAEAAALVEVLIGQGSHEADLWDEVRALIQEKGRLAKIEWDRLKALGQMLTAEQAMTFVGAVAAVVRENVQDRVALQRISEGVNRLLARRAGVPAETLVAPEDLRPAGGGPGGGP